MHTSSNETELAQYHGRNPDDLYDRVMDDLGEADNTSCITEEEFVLTDLSPYKQTRSREEAFTKKHQVSIQEREKCSDKLPNKTEKILATPLEYTEKGKSKGIIVTLETEYLESSPDMSVKVNEQEKKFLFPNNCKDVKNAEDNVTVKIPTKREHTPRPFAKNVKWLDDDSINLLNKQKQDESPEQNVSHNATSTKHREKVSKTSVCLDIEQAASPGQKTISSQALSNASFLFSKTNVPRQHIHSSSLFSDTFPSLSTNFQGLGNKAGADPHVLLKSSPSSTTEDKAESTFVTKNTIFRQSTEGEITKSTVFRYSVRDNGKYDKNIKVQRKPVDIDIGSIQKALKAVEQKHHHNDVTNFDHQKFCSANQEGQTEALKENHLECNKIDDCNDNSTITTPSQEDEPQPMPPTISSPTYSSTHSIVSSTASPFSFSQKKNKKKSKASCYTSSKAKQSPITRRQSFTMQGQNKYSLVYRRVTEIDGRLKRTRQIQKKNPRRETLGDGVLAPRRSRLIHPMFKDTKNTSTIQESQNKLLRETPQVDEHSKREDFAFDKLRIAADQNQSPLLSPLTMCTYDTNKKASPDVRSENCSKIGPPKKLEILRTLPSAAASNSAYFATPKIENKKVVWLLECDEVKNNEDDDENISPVALVKDLDSVLDKMKKQLSPSKHKDLARQHKYSPPRRRRYSPRQDNENKENFRENSLIFNKLGASEQSSPLQQQRIQARKWRNMAAQAAKAEEGKKKKKKKGKKKKRDDDNELFIVQRHAWDQNN